jgi:hypothetical protein
LYYRETDDDQTYYHLVNNSASWVKNCTFSSAKKTKYKQQKIFRDIKSYLAELSPDFAQ